MSGLMRMLYNKVEMVGHERKGSDFPSTSPLFFKDTLINELTDLFVVVQVERAVETAPIRFSLSVLTKGITLCSASRPIHFGLDSIAVFGFERLYLFDCRTCNASR